MDFVCKLLGLVDIYNIIVRTSLCVQQVNKYPWEYDDEIQHLQDSLNNYVELLEKLDLHATQEMDSTEGKTLFYMKAYNFAFDQCCFYFRTSTICTS